MDSKTLKALIEAGAVKQVSIIADGATVHIKFTTRNGDSNPATTLKGAIKTWSTIDSAAKWLRGHPINAVCCDRHTSPTWRAL
tara:strand:+ start:7712 stop:7960 length:249 start_codon:yes stop_codon:yes gene_type:complete